MHINGKRVLGISMVREFGDLKTVEIDCMCCGSAISSAVKVSFDDSWDDTDEVAVCADCLISDGWFEDYNDIK